MTTSIFIRLAQKLPDPETADFIVVLLCAAAVIFLWLVL